MELVLFMGIFFLLILVVSVIYYATVVVPPVRTLGKEKKAEQPIEYSYNIQFGPLLGWRMKPVDWNPDNTKRLYDMSGNII
jgi:hypothetical protein